jgi:hypothetical protein
MSPREPFDADRYHCQPFLGFKPVKVNNPITSVHLLTVQEMEPGSRAAAEIAALWQWLSAKVQLCTDAHVQEGQHEQGDQ